MATEDLVAAQRSNITGNSVGTYVQ